MPCLCLKEYTTGGTCIVKECFIWRFITKERQNSTLRYIIYSEVFSHMQALESHIPATNLQPRVLPIAGKSPSMYR